MPFSEHPEAQAWIRLWTRILLVCCAVAAALVLAALWVLNGFHGLGVDANVAIALLLGAVLATGLGVALMGLIFYSDASRTDESVRDFSAEPRDHDERSDSGTQRDRSPGAQ